MESQMNTRVNGLTRSAHQPMTPFTQRLGVCVVRFLFGLVAGMVGMAGGMGLVLLVQGAWPNLVQQAGVALIVYALVRWACELEGAGARAEGRGQARTVTLARIGQGDYERTIAGHRTANPKLETRNSA
jgi:hypothetical protein